MSPSPEHDAAHARAQDDLAALALGEPADPSVSDHIADCERCRHALAELTSLVELAKGGPPGRSQAAPPPHLWDRIAAEVAALEGPASAGSAAVADPGAVSAATATAAATPPGPRATAVPLDRSRRHRVRRAVLAAAAVVAVGLAGGVGWVLGAGGSDADTATVSAAALAAQPGVRDEAHGTAKLRPGTGGYQLDVQARGLPAHEGYFEVWLYNPREDKMVAVGTLGTGGRGVFTVPAGIDLRSYYVVDVSAQRFDGNPAHDRSVLRGALPAR
ncbi:anti-sigma factor domain-containing protein [Jatrophihabitans fulvus]